MPDRAPAEPSAEAERRRKADSTRPPGPPRPLSAAQEFLLWRDALIASSENNEDALWLAVELARIGQPLVSASSRLTNEEATEWAGLLVRLAYAVKDPDIVREVVKLRQVYLDANQAMPAALHRFDPGFVQRPRGRPKKRIRAEADLEHARRIYAARRRDGCFPDLTCDPWHLLHHLSTEVERQIKTDRGITKTLRDLADTLPLSEEALKQLWCGSSQRKTPSLRRRLIIESMAWHCLYWWRDRRKASAR